MIGAVRWWQTYQWMVEKLGVEKFVNIGPADTLLRFAERIPVHNKITLMDSLQDGSLSEITRTAKLVV